MKKLLVAAGITAVVLVTSGLHAQEQATLALKSGERISGELVDMRAVGFIVRVNGQDRTISTSDVASVEFAGGAVPADAQNRINSGQPVAVLRSGEIVEGRLTDIGGTQPLRLTFATSNGQRELSSSDVAQVHLARLNDQAGATSAEAITVRVPANREWTDTGLAVRRGERLQFNATGHIMVAENASSGVGGSPIPPRGSLPVRGAGVGALIARVGKSDPFLVASNTSPIPMPATGYLQLGINDEQVGDNTGWFTVAIAQLDANGREGR